MVVINYDDDFKKKKESEEDSTRIDELKHKLYSTVEKNEAVRERGFKPHAIDVGQSWEETDAKQARLRAQEEERIKREKEGLANENYLHYGSGLYGHYSPAEDIVHNKHSIKTNLDDEQPKPDKKESVYSFLSDTFADKRATEAQKKMAATDVAMKYASSQIDKDIYPHISGKEEKSIEDTSPTVLENYRPEFSVFTVGDNTLNSFHKETTRASSPLDAKTNIPQVETKKEEASKESKSRFSFSVFIFTTMFLFFLAALVYAYIFFQKGTSVISPDKVEMVISGPISVKSGEINDFSIEITNHNNVDLTLSDLVIQYPYGTMSAIDASIPLTNDRIDLGTIKPEETVRRKVSAVFFGEENVKKNIAYAVEFSIPDSTSIFSSTKDIGVVISGSPVTAKIVNVKEVTNNQDLTFDVEIQSNTEEVVKNIQLQVEYPFGYKLTQSNLEPVFGNNTWNLGDIAALDTKTIRLTGKLIGTSNLEKNFRFTLGVSDPKSGEMITVLSAQDQKVIIEKPFITTKLSLNGLVRDVTAVTYEDIIQGDIVFTNNLDVPITDAVVEVSIGGVLIDKGSIKPHDGFYRSTDDVIFWDKSQVERLASVDPGEDRELTFNMSIIKSKENLIRLLRKAKGNISVTIKAKRLNEKLVPEEMISIITQELRLQTDVDFQSSILHAYGPLQNTGPFPPQVNKETTYTYTAKIANTANAIKDLTFIAKLPPNVTWKNVYTTNIPAKSVSYSVGRKEVTITLGNLEPGTGIDTPVKEFSFQVGFTPNVTQFGTAPVLILNPRISAVDTFTGVRIDKGIDSLSIIPTGDSGNIGDGSVTQ